MSRRRLLTIVLILLTAFGCIIGRYWYDIAQVVIEAGLFSLENTIADTQAIKQWIFLFQGMALGAVCFASFRLKGALWLKLASGIMLLGWLLLVMVHAVLGGGILS